MSSDLHTYLLQEGIVKELGRDMGTLLYLKWITKKDLLFSTENSAQCYVAAWKGGELGGGWITGVMYAWVPLLST